MAKFAYEFSTILVEYMQQVIAYELIEFMQYNITQNRDFSIRGLRSQKPE